MKNHSSLFFSDGEKTIDFVLVYKSALLVETRLTQFKTFIENLLKTDLDVEVEEFTVDSSITFLKIHASDDIIFHFADLYSIDLACRSIYYRPTTQPPPNFMGTPLTIPDKKSDIYQRAPKSLFLRRPTAITSAERIMVLYEMLSRMKYGKRHDQYGITRLLQEKVFVDAYPLHEGPYEWTEFGKLTDRQLLAKFWGNIRCWYKEQPINLIEKYYGTEFAFYFAWVGYYVKMLVPLTVLSILCILYGVVTIPTRQNARSHEICSSNLLMCPTCHYTHCKYESLRSSCVPSHVTYVFDNPATITLAIIISVWSTIFMECWQRSQAVLQLRWNVKSIEDDTLKRPEYLEHATETKFSTITETSEPRMSNKVICVGYTITLLTLLLMLVLVISAVLGVIVYQTSVSLILIRNSKEPIIFDHTRMIASVTGACMIAIFIFIFRAIFRVVALKLTNLENHRTQKEFDNSYIFKRFSLEFINNYSAVFYIAFFRGRFFTHPGDMVKWTVLGGLASDMCDPTGCFMDLGLSLMIIMMSKIVVENFAQFLLPKIIAKFKKIQAKIQLSEDLPVLYEKEYFMSATEQYFLVDEYLDMVIQYGFVVFFAAGFPLAPALAFFNNLLEIRVDSSKLTKSHRRPIPRKTSDLGAWFGILQAITYIGVAINALVIAFNSNCIQNEIYRHTNDQELEGFLNSTISAFAIEDFRILDKSMILEKSMHSPKLCFYPGRRYPPDDEHKYELTKDFWFLLAMRVLVVLIFEHVIIMMKGMLAYAIPDVPGYVTLQLALQERRNKDLRMKALNAEYMEKRREMGLKTVLTPIDLL